MRLLKTIVVLAVFLFGAASSAFSDDLKVRVTASKANIRLKPDTQSVIVAGVPLGAVLDVIRKEGDWYYVKLPPDEKGIVVTGFLHQSTVEIIEDIEQKKMTQDLREKPAIKEPETLTKAAIAKLSLSEKERYFMETDPYYPSWRQKLDQARKEQGGAKKWMWIGGGAMLVGYAAVPLLAVSSLNERSTGESQDKIVTAGVIAGTVGGALLTYGLIRYYIKGRKASSIMEEGMIKGYILGLNIDPQKKQYALTFALAF